MTLNPELLRDARAIRDRVFDLQNEVDQAQVVYQHAIRRLHADGAPLREIADALALSYQRVHQIVDVGSGKGAVKECGADGVCSFCGEGRRQDRKLIAGPGVFICEDCVDLSTEVLAEGEERSTGLARLVVETDADAACNFCGKRRGQVEAMVLAPDRPTTGKFGRRRRARQPLGVRACFECLALCGEILAEHS